MNMKNNNEITGIILAGGKSSRMGTDKAFLKFGDKYFIDIALELMAVFFKNIIIIANQKEKFSYTNCNVFPDIYPDKGPLGGLHSGLSHTKTEWNFVLNCDMPFINRELISYILNYKKDKKIIIPEENGQIQPLCGVYNKSCLPDINKSIIENNDLSLYKFFNKMDAKIIDVTCFPFYTKKIFLNINTQDDYNLLFK